MPKSIAFFAAVAAGACPVVQAATPAPSIHIRGAVKTISGSMLVVSTAAGPVRIALRPGLQVVDIVPTSRTQIKDNSFVGITSVAGPGGSQRAVEVHVFPEAMRGAGEGSRPWDYPGAAHTGSKMTNGTVHVGTAHAGSRMTNGTVKTTSRGVVSVSYKGPGAGSQMIVLPSGIPVVTFHPGKPSDLKPGVRVFVMATRGAGGALVAGRVMVGEGIAPPM